MKIVLAAGIYCLCVCFETSKDAGESYFVVDCKTVKYLKHGSNIICALSFC